MFLSQLINSNGPCTFFTIEFVDDRGGEEEAAIVGLEGDLLDRLLLLPFSFWLIGILSVALLEPDSIEVILAFYWLQNGLVIHFDQIHEQYIFMIH